MKTLLFTLCFCVAVLAQAADSKELIRNGEFKNLQNWKTKSNLNKAKFELSPQAGNGLRMTILKRSPKGSGIDIYQKDVQLNAGKYYCLKLNLKKLSGTARVSIAVKKNSKWVNIFYTRSALTNDKLQKLSFFFKAPETEKACVRIRLNTNLFHNASVLVNNISLKTTASPLQKKYVDNFDPEKLPKVQSHKLKNKWKPKQTRKELPVENWKYMPLANTNDNPANDKGTVNKFYKTDYNDQDWAEYKIHNPRNHKKKLSHRVEWYRTKFTAPKLNSSQRLLLVFDGLCTSDTKLYLNGKNIASHYSRIIPFSVDITDKINAGKNSITLRLFTEKGKRTRYEPGLSDKVWLKVVPATRTANIMVSPRLDMKGIIVATKIINDNSLKNFKLRYYIYPWNKALTSAKTTFGEYKINPSSKSNFELKFFTNLIDPKLWSPQTPFLYNLTTELVDNKGKIIDINTVRFGYRQFIAKNGKLYLNGNATLLMGVVWGGINREKCSLYLQNGGKYFRKYLTLLKQNNVNHARTHRDPWPQRMLEIADEVGFMIVLEDINANKRLKKPKRALKQLVQTVKFYYNHPSIIMWDFGNELWQCYHNYTPYLTKAYIETRKIDVSQRPILSSSGRGSHGIEEGLIQPTDIVAVHKYTGQNNAPWHMLGKKLKAIHKDYNKVTKANKISKKTICFFENFGLMSHLHHFHKGCPFCKDRDYILYQPLPNKTICLRGIYYNPSNKTEFVEAMRKFNKDSRNGMVIRAYASIGSRYSADGFSQQHIMAAEGKELIEEWRKNCDIIPGYEALPFQWGYNSVLNSGARGSANEPLRPQPLLEECYKIVFNPWFVCANVFDKNHFAGRPLKLALYTMNNSDRNAKSKLKVVAKIFSTGKEKKLFKEKQVLFDALKIDSRQIKNIEFQLPKDLPTGIYRIDLALIENNKKLGNNWYYFYSLNPKDQLKSINCQNKKIAVYGKDQALNKILKGLKVKFNIIKNLSELKDYQFLIINKSANYEQLSLYSKAINKWLKKGGQLLALNLKTGKIPWATEYSIVKNSGVSKLHIVIPGHPVFKELLPFNFKHWNTGNKHQYIGKSLISPIDENVIGAGSEKTGNKTLTSIGEYSRGKGKFVISQLDAVPKYNYDSSATKYMNNLLAYFLKAKSQKLNIDSLKPISKTELAKSLRITPDKNGFIKDWMVMGPFPNPGSRLKGEYQGFKTDYLKDLGGEIKVKPSKKQQINFHDKNMQHGDVAEGRILKWQKLGSSGAKIDLLSFWGGNYNVAYAACYVIMPKAQKVKLSIGSDDGTKVYLNHKLVINDPKHRNAKPDQNQVIVNLHKGSNLVLVKVDNSINGWCFYFRFLTLKDIPITNYTIEVNK